MQLQFILRLSSVLASVLITSTAVALPTELRGSLLKLPALSSGQAARLSLQTPDGLYELKLGRAYARRPTAYLRAGQSLNSSFWDLPLLFRGSIRAKRGQRLPGKLRGVAADLYHGQLALRFYGTRSLRLYTATFPLAGDARRLGRLSHLPSNFPLNCAFERGSTTASVGNLALASVDRPRRALDFAADLDAEYLDAAGGSEGAAAEVAQSMNVVNGIYGDQLGVEVALVEQNEFSDAGSQPYQTNEAEDLRDQVAAYRNANPFSASFDAAQLFTGKEMYLPDPDIGTGIVGISYLSIHDDFSDPGTVCRYDNDYSYTVVERYVPSGRSFSATYQGVLTAHELGHNLSLFHINSGVMYFAPSSSDSAFAYESIASALQYMQVHGQCLDQIGPGVSMDSLRFRLGRLTARLSPNNYLGESCSLRLYAAGGREILLSDTRRHSEATLIKSVPISSASVSLKANVGDGRSAAKNYYLLAEMLCDGQIRGVSGMQRISSRFAQRSSFYKSLRKNIRRTS